MPLRAAVDLVEHMIPVQRRETRPLQALLDLVEQRPLGAHQVGPGLDHGGGRLGCSWIHDSLAEYRLHLHALHRIYAIALIAFA